MKRVINSANGTPEDPEWLEGSPHVVKIVIGPTPGSNGEAVSLVGLGEGFAERFPNLTHLYLWKIDGLTQMPSLPEQLECLDLRGCAELATVPNLPSSLETLALEGCEILSELPVLAPGDLPALDELFIAGCAALPEAWIGGALAAAPKLRRFDASRCPQLVRLDAVVWPEGLDRIDLNQCPKLRRVPKSWPPTLRRLGLRRSGAIEKLPDFPPAADYLDLAYTESLKSLPALHGAPRTVFLYGSGVDLDPDLFGDGDETNVAREILADLRESGKGRVADNDLKIILLGKGRCGKSSLARRWIEGRFDPQEKSTHGIRHWRHEVDFQTAEGSTETAVTHVWDFAGQDLYHSTHRLFLQNRAIFVLCYTGHCDGADPATDAAERERDEEEDIPRTLNYWLEQVRSLGTVPGLGIESPIITVRTKVDRDPQEPLRASRDPLAGEDAIDFSAESGHGLDELEEAISKQVSVLLGSWMRRSLPITVKQVKDHVQDLIRYNDAEYRQAEAQGRLARSPHPVMTREAFDARVRQCCPSGDYHQDPGLLLHRFHASGLVFYDARRLPEEIIVDQRWAIEAIYAFANRESKTNIREGLWRRGGIVSQTELRDRVWGPLGYSAEEQELILQFMRSCGMVFILLQPSELRVEPLYAIPGFFPDREDKRVRFPEIESGPTGAWQAVELPCVSEEDMIALLGWIGSHWSRSADLWRWGARLSARDTQAMLLLDWIIGDPETDYYGVLRLWFEGPVDREFESIVREAIEERLSASEYREQDHMDRLWPVPRERGRPQDLAEIDGEFPPREARSSLESKTGGPEEREGFRITFSLAGKSDAEPNLDRVPRLLAERMADLRVGAREVSVTIYSNLEGEENISSFGQDIAAGHLVVLFWSQKYWYSEYCMAEFLEVYDREPRGKLPKNKVLVYALGGARLKHPVDRREGEPTIDQREWKNYWGMEATRRLRRSTESLQEDDTRGAWEHARFRDSQPRILLRWFNFVENEEAFDEFARNVVEYGASTKLPIPRDAEEARHIVDEIWPNVLRRIEQAVNGAPEEEG